MPEKKKTTTQKKQSRKKTPLKKTAPSRSAVAKKSSNTISSMDTPTQTPGPQIPQEKHEHVQLFIALGVIVLLGIAFLGGLWYVDSRAIESVRTLDDGEVLTQAKEGRVVPNFPKELLSEGSDRVRNSYSLEYPGGTNQPVVRYESRLTMGEAIVRTVQHFQDSGWAIVKDPNTEALRTTSFYAVRPGGDEANVTFIQETSVVVVEIAIVDKTQ